jgi:hypothetical protein
MNIQQPIDYSKILAELLSRRGQLIAQRDAAQLELLKVQQLILAIFPLLHDSKQKKGYQQTIERIEAEAYGLQDAIKLVFSAHKGEWLSASNVRDFLIEMGYDLRRYHANPISSISTTLKRMVPDYLEAAETGSGATFRRNPDPFYGE